MPPALPPPRRAADSAGGAAAVRADPGQPAAGRRGGRGRGPDGEAATRRFGVVHHLFWPGWRGRQTAVRPAFCLGSIWWDFLGLETDS